MMLSKLIPALDNREVARALGDAQRLHALVLRAFDPAEVNARRTHGVLHRVDVGARGDVAIFVQSRSIPDWSRLPPEMLVEVTGPKPIDDAFAHLRKGDVLHFRLRANVARRIDTKSGPDGKRRNGRRVPLRDDATRVRWLTRKGELHGFEIVKDPFGDLELRLRCDPLDHGVRAGKELTFAGVRYDGRLRVTDPGLFASAVETGFGPAKAYGFGLMSIARG